MAFGALRAPAGKFMPSGAQGNMLAQIGSGNSGGRHSHFDMHDKPGYKGGSIPSRFDGVSHAIYQGAYVCLNL